jgi:uncharacterized membrane protein YkoI
MGRIMKRTSLSCLLILAMMLAGFGSNATWASDSKDHERARAALGAGQIRPLADILTEVEHRYLGRVIETELDQEDGRWVYDFKLLPPTGQVFKLDVDATTGALLRSKGTVQERR